MTESLIDVVWLAVATALVFLMQAGFALLECGLVRSKNAVNVLMKNYIDVGMGAIAFWMLGFGLMFGTNPSGWFGTDGFMLNSGTDWDFSFLVFNMMFAATAATIVSGALAERIRYWGYITSAVLISAFIYPIFGSWAWGSKDGISQGWLRSLGFVDFAGSTVVHSVGGWCALAGIVVLGPRLGRFSKDGKARAISGHNLPLVALGGMILWLGWFGFNAGSTLQASPKIGTILLNTHLAGSGGVVGAVLCLALLQRPALITSTINGGLGGMVAICALCDRVQPIYALITGLIGGIVVILGSALIARIGLDDAVGAVAVHGLAGAWGTLAVGLFGGAQLFDLQLLKIQALGIGTCFLWTFPIAFTTFKAIDLLFALRASTLAQQRGLDYTEHYEICYPEFQQNALHQGKT